MYIEKIHIDTFGKLDNCDIAFTSGVNIIEGANESGKSTIAAFIKFVLYGIPTKERKRYLSWRSGGAAGSITVNTGTKRYRIERALAGAREAVQLIDANTNMQIRGALDGTTPGELLFGVDAEMFSATAFVSQLGSAPNGAKLSEGIENILFSADESVNTQKALAKLDNARVALLHKNQKGGKLFNLDNECAALELRLSDALNSHREILIKEAQLEDIRENLKNATEKAQKIEAKVANFERKMILGLFERKSTLKRKTEAIKAAIDRAGAPDPEYVNKLVGFRDRVKLLRSELDDAQKRGAAITEPVLSEKAGEYQELGGREALESKCAAARSTAKSYMLVGVIMAILALAALTIGLAPTFGGGSPNIAFIVAFVAVAAAASTLFVFFSRNRERANEIEEKYDFDKLDAELESYKAAKDNVGYSELVIADARRRFDEERAKIKQLSGVEPDELDAKLAELQVQMKKVDGLKAEYDKITALLSHIDEQLAPYREDEIREKLDAEVDISDVDASNLPSLRREAEVASKMAAALEKHEIEIEKTLAGAYPTAEDPTKLTDKLNSLKLERDELSKKHAAYLLAYEKLSQASDDLRESIVPRLASDAARIMESITDGKYTEIGVGVQMDITAVTENGLRDIGVLSSGTQDAAYLSLRIALVKMLYGKNLPTMIYDESFIRQDDARLGKILKIIADGEMQSIIFTANNRDASFMSSYTNANLISL